MASDVMLAVELCNITKRFGSLHANRNVNIAIRRGEIHAIVGENGAGKSTLMKVLYGFFRPDEGEVKIHGTTRSFSSPLDAISAGIGMVHQHFMLIPTLTVAENIILGHELATSRYGVLKPSFSDTLQAWLEQIKMSLPLHEPVGVLPVGLQQKVEIAKLLYRRADILIMDEPTAVLTPQEASHLFHTFRDLKEQGRTIIFITHKLHEVTAVSDRITVMRKGEVVGTRETAAVSSREIATMMIGEEFDRRALNKTPTQKGEVILSLKHVSVSNSAGKRVLKDISFEIASGEILGIAGVEGNGQQELIQAILRLRPVESGVLSISGRQSGSADPTAVALIPEDRLKHAVVPDFTIAENAILGRQREPQFSAGWKLRFQTIHQFTDSIISDYAVDTPSRQQPIRMLSGGNQQKVVIGRESTKNARLLIADQPTRGLDIGAVNGLHRMLLSERQKGRAILLISSDLTELLELSDRIAVLFDGMIPEIFDASATTESELGARMVGASAS